MLAIQEFDLPNLGSNAFQTELDFGSLISYTFVVCASVRL
jgi:hypothetical protein